jgi:drug/metabolite transporter (DMT)-like permease
MEASENPSDNEDTKLADESSETVNPKFSILSKLYDKIELYRGILYASLSAFFSSVTHIILRRCTYFYGSDQVLVRYIIQLILVSIFYYFHSRKAKLNDTIADSLKGKRKLLLLRGLFGAIGILSVVFSIKLINPSDTIAILNCKIVLISVCSKVFLNEKYTIVHILSILMTIFGILLISLPGFLTNMIHGEANSTSINATTTPNFAAKYAIPNHQTLGVCLAFIAALSVTVIYILIKKLCNQHIHVSIIMLYGSYFGLPAALLVSIFMHIFNDTVKPSAPQFNFDTMELVLQVCLTLLSGVFEVVSQLCTNVALKHEDASKIALVKSSEMFLTSLFQYVFLGIVANGFGLVGGLLIFISMCTVLVHKIFDQKFKSEHAKPGLFKQIIFFKF